MRKLNGNEFSNLRTVLFAKGLSLSEVTELLEIAFLDAEILFNGKKQEEKKEESEQNIDKNLNYSNQYDEMSIADLARKSRMIK